MRATAIVPLACAVVAFLLSMLVLFAGDTPKMLPSVYMLRLNTSALGQIKPFGDSEPEEDDNSIGGLFSSGIDKVQELGNDAVSAAGGLLTDALNIPDFYSAHLMTHCEGKFEPDFKDPKASGVPTECSERRAFNNFDPTKLIESKLPEGFGLSDLKWPDAVTVGIKAISTASKAMFFFYVVGIGATGVAMIGSVFGLLAYEHRVAMANLAVNSLGFLCLGLASAISTVVIFKATEVINDAGQSLGLEADRGNAFLGMTWTATILMLLATGGWVGEFMMGRRRSYYKEEQYY